MMSRTITLALFALALSSLSAPCDARVPSRDLLAFHGRSLLEFENITLPELPYEYSALEPVISAEIMELHHDKHHRSFLAGFNTAVAGLIAAQDSNNVASIVTLTSALNFNGGGAKGVGLAYHGDECVIRRRCRATHRCVLVRGLWFVRATLGFCAHPPLSGWINHNLFWPSLTPVSVSRKGEDVL